MKNTKEYVLKTTSSDNVNLLQIDKSLDNFIILQVFCEYCNSGTFQLPTASGNTTIRVR